MKKFRAWDPASNRMCYNLTVDYDCEHGFSNAYYENGEGFHDLPIMLQYIGLKDKNGKEIYEGDIIDKGNRAVVRFSCGRFQPAYDKGMAEDMEDEFYRFSDTVEVIGNIYENADILEDEYE